jgi:PAS domain S-box-containing protein
MMRVARGRRRDSRRVAGVVLLAALMLASVFVLRLDVDRADAAVSLLFALPVALLAVELGAFAGLAGAGVATTLVVVWASTANANLDVMGYVSRAGTFVLLGGLLGIFADRLHAAALRAERAQRRSVLILESSGDAIYEVRGDGTLAYANPVAVALTGWEAAELAGKDAHATFHHSRADGAPYPVAECPIQATLRDGTRRHVDDEVFWTRSGEPIAVEYTASPMTIGSAVIGVVVTARDVSQRRYQQHRLRHYADHLTAADTREHRREHSGATGAGREQTDEGYGESAIQSILEVARQHLCMDLAFLAELGAEQERIEAIAGDAASFGLDAGSSIPLAGSYCYRLIKGELPNVVTDARHDARVRDLPITTTAKIGSYVGVPVTLGNGEIYGVLCCLGHAADPDVDDSQVHFMKLLAGVVAVQLDHERVVQERHRLERERGRADIAQSHVRALIAALETRDEYTGSHCESVVSLAERVAAHLELTADEIFTVKQTALLHDIGKVGVPDAILQKPDTLDDLEWDIMRQHPAIGARLIASIEPLAHLAPAIRAEHERWDGAGYPDGLSGEQIPLAARIGFACDAFHAMTSDRPYRRAMSETHAIAELHSNAATQFDPRVVRALISVRDPSPGWEA